MGREAAASAALKSGTRSNSENCGGFWREAEDYICSEKKASAAANALSEFSSAESLFVVFVVVVVFVLHSVRSMHAPVHVFYHGVKFCFLLVGQQLAHLGVGRVMHAHHLGILVFF